MHQIAVTILCRLRPKGNWPFFLVPENPLSVGNPTISSVNPLFSLPGNRGQKVTQNGGPQFSACLILSEKKKEVILKLNGLPKRFLLNLA